MNVRKLVVAAAAVLAMGAAASAYEWSECWKNYGGGIEEHDLIINAGVGVNSMMFVSGRSGFIPPVELNVEFMQKIWVLPFGFGGFFGFSGYNEKYDVLDGGYTQHFKNFYFGAFANYHLQLPVEKLDVYAGMRVGAEIVRSDWELGGRDEHDVAGGVYWGGTLGASWFFTDFFGVNLEFGYPTFARLGVSFKI
ncbi:MAG: hypothetical protein K2H09_05035 [Treponemataceae bacterium]|nr:hypothetical protein [Treponemataceae bacterium]